MLSTNLNTAVAAEHIGSDIIENVTFMCSSYYHHDYNTVVNKSSHRLVTRMFCPITCPKYKKLNFDAQNLLAMSLWLEHQRYNVMTNK